MTEPMTTVSIEMPDELVETLEDERARLKLETDEFTSIPSRSEVARYYLSGALGDKWDRDNENDNAEDDSAEE